MPSQLLSAIAPPRAETPMPSETEVEARLLISELRYRRLFETAQDGILILDADSGKIDDVNPFLQELLGYTEEELVGKQLWEIGVFKDIVDSKAAFFELQEKGYIRYKDLPLQTKDGRSIDVEFISNVYMVAHKKVIQCNIRDITERKHAEETVKSKTEKLEQLSQSQEDTKHAMLNIMEDLETAKELLTLEKVKDEAMLSSIGEGLIAVSNELKIMIINKAAEDMLDWKMDGVIGKELTMFPLEDEQGNVMPIKEHPVQVALTSGKTINNTYYYVRRNKTRLPIAITVTPINLAGKKIGAIIIFRDVTHEREIDKAKSEFVSLASHQLRTPLGIVKWYLEAVGDDAYIQNAPDNIQKYFSEITKSNERVLSLVRDLLSVSRIEQGRVKNVPTFVDILVRVREIVEQMQIVANNKNVSLALTIGNKNIPSVTIDVLRFHEVLENLIGNAIEYTKSEGAVEVIIDRKDDQIFISVKDSGIGISIEDQKKLFTKFFRSEKAVSHNPEGSGLGLYVVKAYIEGWGGNILVESAEEKGSTFTLSLPISQKSVV